MGANGVHHYTTSVSGDIRTYVHTASICCIRESGRDGTAAPADMQYLQISAGRNRKGKRERGEGEEREWETVRCAREMGDENVNVRETRDEMRGECNETSGGGGEREVCMYVHRKGGSVWG